MKDWFKENVTADDLIVMGILIVCVIAMLTKHENIASNALGVVSGYITGITKGVIANNKGGILNGSK